MTGSNTSLTAKAGVREIRDRIHLYMGERPSIFFNYYRLKKESRVVRPSTELVIEGFPRSANTFSVWAFRQAQSRDVELAHHLHFPAQIIRAVEWNIPAVILLRDPESAVTSLVMKDSPTIGQALRHYVSFYETVAENLERCAIAPFEEVISDYGAVIRRVNERFGTDFAEFEHSDANVAKVFERIEERHRTRNGGVIMETRIARPSPEKAAERKRVEPELANTENILLFETARRLYEHLGASV